MRLHDGVDQRHRGRGSGASGRARLLAQAVAGMGRPSMRGHSCAAVHLREPFDGVSCSAPCRLVGSTASCEAQPVSLCTRWAHASMRAGRDPPAGFYAEFPHSTTSWAAHLATARPDPRCLRSTGRNKNSLPAARWKAHVSTCNGSLVWASFCSPHAPINSYKMFRKLVLCRKGRGTWKGALYAAGPGFAR